MTTFVCLAIWLYRLLKDVQREAAQWMVAFVLVCVAIALLSGSNELAALRLLKSNDPAQAMLALGLYKDGILIAAVFMGCGSFHWAGYSINPAFCPRRWASC